MSVCPQRLRCLCFSCYSSFLLLCSKGIESSALYFNLILLFAPLSFTSSCALVTVTIFYVLETSCTPGLINPGLTYPGDNQLLQLHTLTANARFCETG